MKLCSQGLQWWWHPFEPWRIFTSFGPLWMLACIYYSSPVSYSRHVHQNVIRYVLLHEFCYNQGDAALEQTWCLILAHAPFPANTVEYFKAFNQTKQLCDDMKRIHCPTIVFVYLFLFSILLYCVHCSLGVYIRGQTFTYSHHGDDCHGNIGLLGSSMNCFWCTICNIFGLFWNQPKNNTDSVKI